MYKRQPEIWNYSIFQYSIPVCNSRGYRQFAVSVFLGLFFSLRTAAVSAFSPAAAVAAAVAAAAAAAAAGGHL